MNLFSFVPYVVCSSDRANETIGYVKLIKHKVQGYVSSYPSEANFWSHIISSIEDIYSFLHAVSEPAPTTPVSTSSSSVIHPSDNSLSTLESSPLVPSANFTRNLASPHTDHLSTSNPSLSSTSVSSEPTVSALRPHSPTSIINHTITNIPTLSHVSTSESTSHNSNHVSTIPESLVTSPSTLPSSESIPTSTQPVRKCYKCNDITGTVIACDSCGKLFHAHCSMYRQHCHNVCHHLSSLKK